MKIFSIIFILLLSLQSLIKADDIRDFEIEGISIGDSALEFFNKNEIKVKQYPKSNKFSRATILIDSESYDYIQFHFKTKDISFEIFGISGQKIYKKNINECYSNLEVISDELSEIFFDIEKKPYSKKHAWDTTGKSTNKGDNFYFPDGSYINIACYDWSNEVEKENNFVDNLRVTIIENELANWLRDEAY
tara:strand:+ start:79 stop:651 length:573 start_codon:yes stop_codon:yes gene_type:complete